MKLTPDILRQNGEAMIAFANGKPVQGWSTSEQRFFDESDPGWDCSCYRYRPKPEPRVRWWNCVADVPLNCWLHFNGAAANSFALIVHLDEDGLTIVSHRNELETKPWLLVIEWGAIEHYTHSTDLKQWRPCTVTEDAP